MKSARWNKVKSNVFRTLFSFMVIAIALFSMQSFKWYRSGDGRIVTEVENIKMPLDSLINPEPNVAVYKRVETIATYTRGTFPLVNKEARVNQVKYYTKND